MYIGLAVVTQEVQAEVAQLGKNAGVFTDTAGILTHSCVEDVVQPVFYAPMPANGMAQRLRRGDAGGKIAR